MTRSDGIDLDARVAEDMRAWYLDLLRSGPVWALAPVDMSLTARVTEGSDGWMQIRRASTVVRVTAVKLAGWERAVAPGAGGTYGRGSGNKYACGGVANPVAELGPDQVLRLRGAASGTAVPAVEVLEVVTDPGPGRYVMDECAVALIGRCAAGEYNADTLNNML